MDPVLLAALAALFVALAALVIVLLRRGDGAMAALAGRLSQMAESQAAQQAALAARMQEQERALAKAIEDRLADFGKRVGDRLQEQTAQATQSMGELKERLAVIDAAQKNITELSSQVVGLQDILSNKQARGRFGEVLLENLIRDALPASAYRLQAPLGGGRVDCLVTLPHPPGPIGIDAKFPREGYEALRDARDEAAQVAARRILSASVKKHVQDIAEKYIVPGETAECALMFVPSEAIYAELHANFWNLVEEAHRARVWIVSPSTLMAMLATIRAILRDVEMRKEAAKIQKEVQTLLEDVRRLGDRAENLQRHFRQAVVDVEQIQISATKIADRGERIRDVQLEAPPEPARVTAVGNNA